MKKQIRRGVFETNSSSVHSLTMCTAEEYKSGKTEKFYFVSMKICLAQKKKSLKN